MPRRLRLGVIGAGAWAVASHLPNFARRRDVVDFVGVSRKGAATLERIRDTWGFSVASEDYGDVLEAGVDICVVSSPAALHHEHAAAALASGAHVLLEKPVTVSPHDAWDLVRRAQSADRHVVIAFGWNYVPMVVRAKALLDEHPIGQIEHVALRMASAARALLSAGQSYLESAEVTPEPATWIDATLAGGGYAQAQLSHALGVCLWLTGLRPEHAFAAIWKPAGGSIELHDAAVLRFAGGAVGTVSGTSLHSPLHADGLELELLVVGSDGQLHLDLGMASLTLARPSGPQITERPPASSGGYDCRGPVDAIVDLALGLPAVNRSPLELGAEVVAAIDACYRSAAGGLLEPVVKAQPRAAGHARPQ